MNKVGKRIILIVEDEKKLLNSLQTKLTREGYDVLAAESGELVEEIVKKSKIDLIILDLNLPSKSGTEILEDLRRQGNLTPVLILSVRNKVDDKIKGLNLGADDYLAKPFDFGELSARVHAILSRTDSLSNTKLTACDLELDLINRKVTRGEKNIELSQREFELLHYLLKNRNQVLTNARIAEQVWGYTFSTGTNIVNVYINYLRKSVDDGFEKKIIRTVRGHGFMLVDE